jgi:pimeloyl-ACP methyl ester carboxylesterase
VGLLSLGCIEFKATPQSSDDDSDAPKPVVRAGVPPEIAATLPPDLPQEYLEGQKLGDECSAKKACRMGLSCEDGQCVATGATKKGGDCILSSECKDGQCVDNQCVPYGPGQLGAACLGLAQCAEGLRCGLVNVSPECVATGNADLGQGCKSSNDCGAGLECVQASAADEPTCNPVKGAPPAVPALWTGVACEESDTDHVRAYFEVPGAPEAKEGDFFRLPFPNDIRLDAKGHVDISDFPTPGLNPLVGIDPIAAYVKVVNGMEGWGTNATVTFRFSGPINLGSFSGEDGIVWVDITDPTDPIFSGIGYQTSTGNTNYVCHDMLSIRRADGFPMEPGHVYAVMLTADGKSKHGDKLVRAPNFSAMLQTSAPADAKLAAAYAKFEPMRTYLKTQSIDPDSVLVGTVITVGPTRDLMTDLAAAVRATDLPKASQWTLCDKGVKSPCPQAEESRACGEANSKFSEYHALVELPIFQQGEPPYLTQGGEIKTSKPARTEAVCMSLTIPKGVQQPADGWPLVVFTHGTGGSFRSSVIQKPVAETLSAATMPGGTVNFAVLGYDQVEHGPRRGDSEESPDNLFFNFLNPNAAQGNPLQGAADVLSIGRFASNLDLSAVETGGTAIKVDAQRIVYFGHSQGSMAGSLALPFAPEYKAAVLSGNGVSLMHALLTKTEPVNVKSVVPLVVNDGVSLDFGSGVIKGSLPGGTHHPVLSLVQQYIDPADPLNFAQQIARKPLPGMAPKHVFETYGLGDTFAPPLTMQLYITHANLSIVKADASASPKDEIGTESEVFPFAGSFAVDNVTYTTAARQYGPPADSDGHFVVFDVPSANADAVRFLAMAVSGVTPQIGE